MSIRCQAQQDALGQSQCSCSAWRSAGVITEPCTSKDWGSEVGVERAVGVTGEATLGLIPSAHASSSLLPRLHWQ